MYHSEKQIYELTNFNFKIDLSKPGALDCYVIEFDIANEYCQLEGDRVIDKYQSLQSEEKSGLGKLKIVRGQVNRSMQYYWRISEPGRSRSRYRLQDDYLSNYVQGLELSKDMLRELYNLEVALITLNALHRLARDCRRHLDDYQEHLSNLEGWCREGGVLRYAMPPSIRYPIPIAQWVASFNEKLDVRLGLNSADQS